jgi:hypothetical protein
MPVISTLIRFVYVLGWSWFVLFFVNVLGVGPPPSVISDFLQMFSGPVAFALIAWAVQDIVHFFLDL